MPIEPESLIQDLRSAAPFESDEHAGQAFGVTLSALRDVLSQEETDWLSQTLGPGLSAPLRRPRRPRAASLDSFYRRVRLYAGVRPGVAREQAGVVCRVLTRHLSHDSVQRLKKDLPELAGLFERPDPETLALGPEVLRSEPGSDHTLAGGRPGSSRPLADARPLSRPPSGDAESNHAQAHSIARSTEPHADSKLSSAHGLRQEQAQRSLATARPEGRGRR
jgi:uncharacterized protein (DUF2267 family)